jgi:hypothetical protein
MSRPSNSSKTIPENALQALRAFGENLRVARERRGESLRAWAARMDASVPTIRRMEAGDPTVGAGVFATGLWLCGQADALAGVLSPASDTAAHEIEIARAARRRRK